LNLTNKSLKIAGKPALGGPWVLVDQDGVPKTDASYRGKFCLLYFGFTYCPDICPSELVKIGQIIRGLGGPVLLHINFSAYNLFFHI
jgi:cytochrome oxidase Cu insertion factor (SCO1/SenC/PrrC family)